MKRMIRWLALGLTLLILMTSCNGDSLQPQADGTSDTDTEWQSMDFESVRFATDRQKRVWRRALAKTLRGLRNSYYDPYYADYEGDMGRYLDLDGLVYGRSLAMFDVDTDGVPELLIDMGGGSAGNQEFDVYDIFTGEKKANLSSGWGGTVCTYYNTEEGEYCQINEYTLRGGFDTRYHTVCRYRTGDESGCLFHVSYYLERELITADGPEGETVTGVNERWTAGGFEYLGERVDADEYLSEYEHFIRTHVRIPQTEMRVYSISDLTDGFTDRDCRENAEYMLTARGARRMARRLLAAGQEYIRF